MTVGQPGGRIWPMGAGIGATHVVCDVMSPTRAAGMFWMSTVTDPLTIIPGPAGIQAASMHGTVMSVTRAAGMPPISTVGAQGPIIASGMGG